MYTFHVAMHVENFIHGWLSPHQKICNCLLFFVGFSRTYIGTRANGRPTEWTMNLDPTNVNRVIVLHETGHALGLLHEHLNPDANIEWDFPKVIYLLKVHNLMCII